METEVSNGQPEPAETPVEEREISLTLSLAEAQALKAWLLKPAGDGSSVLEEEELKHTMMQLGAALDYVEGVSAVRSQLALHGLPTDQMSDDEVAELGRKIAEAPLRR